MSTGQLLYNIIKNFRFFGGRQQSRPSQTPTISFCTTCSNRFDQLKQTFDLNEQTVLENRAVEWVIVNFNSQDELHEFITDRLKRTCNRIIYAHETSGRKWHASVAKNVAHRLANGQILMNLDCDNFIGDAINSIREQFDHGCQVLHMWSGIYGDGTFGRIAIRRDRFYQLGGYDESFFPMAQQDQDLLRRAVAAEMPAWRFPTKEQFAIKNSKDSSMRQCRQHNLTWDDFNWRNMIRSMTNIKAGRLVANEPDGWAEMEIATLRRGSLSAPT